MIGSNPTPKLSEFEVGIDPTPTLLLWTRLKQQEEERLRIEAKAAETARLQRILLLCEIQCYFGSFVNENTATDGFVVNRPVPKNGLYDDKNGMVNKKKNNGSLRNAPI